MEGYEHERQVIKGPNKKNLWRGCMHLRQNHDNGCNQQKNGTMEVCPSHKPELNESERIPYLEKKKYIKMIDSLLIHLYKDHF